MSEECLIDFLQDGAVEVSDGKFRQATQHFIEFIVQEKLQGLHRRVIAHPVAENRNEQPSLRSICGLVADNWPSLGLGKKYHH